MTLASGEESDLPACGLPACFSVHQVSSAVTPAGHVHKSQGDNAAVEEMMCVSVTEGHSGDGCVLAFTPELIMCSGGVRSILLFPLVARCLETIDVCIWHTFV